MKLDDLYNFYDGVIPSSRVSSQTMSPDDYTQCIAKAAEKQFTKQLRSNHRNLCYMRGLNIYATSTLERLSQSITSHRDNAIKARELA